MSWIVVTVSMDAKNSVHETVEWAKKYNGRVIEAKIVKDPASAVFPVGAHPVAEITGKPGRDWWQTAQDMFNDAQNEKSDKGELNCLGDAVADFSKSDTIHLNYKEYRLATPLDILRQRIIDHEIRD